MNSTSGKRGHHQAHQQDNWKEKREKGREGEGESAHNFAGLKACKS